MRHKNVDHIVRIVTPGEGDPSDAPTSPIETPPSVDETLDGDDDKDSTLIRNVALGSSAALLTVIMGVAHHRLRKRGETDVSTD